MFRAATKAVSMPQMYIAETQAVSLLQIHESRGDELYINPGLCIPIFISGLLPYLISYLFGEFISHLFWVN